MRITSTYTTFHNCSLFVCKRNYCQEHRLLWRDCDTSREDIDDYYLDGYPHFVITLGDCPECEKEVQWTKKCSY